MRQTQTSDAILLKSAGDTQTHHISIIGDGAVDNGAVAMGKASVGVGGNMTGNITIGQNRD